MAYEESVKAITLLAGADFSTTGRNRFGKIGTDGKIELAGAGERAAGVIGDNVAEDRRCALQIDGVIMVKPVARLPLATSLLPVPTGRS